MKFYIYILKILNFKEKRNERYTVLQYGVKICELIITFYRLYLSLYF